MCCCTGHRSPVSVSARAPMALAGKKALVVGVANHRSIAWGVAQAWKQAGATVFVTYQNDRFRPTVTKLLEGWKDSQIDPASLSAACDVSQPEEVEALFKRVSSRFDGKLDCLCHSVAYASAAAMKKPFLETTPEAFAEAHLISAYSLIALCRSARPLMEAAGGGSVVAMSYLGSQRVIPNYKVMSAAKASLESSARVLAAELGDKKIRVNCVSAGPVNTLAARGIPGFVELSKMAADRSPLRRNATMTEVAQVATFLASEQASAVTGQTIYVDGGYSIMG